MAPDRSSELRDFADCVITILPIVIGNQAGQDAQSASVFAQLQNTPEKWNLRSSPTSIFEGVNSGLQEYGGRYRDIPWRPRQRILPAAAQLVIKRSGTDDVLLGDRAAAVKGVSSRGAGNQSAARRI